MSTEHNQPTYKSVSIRFPLDLLEEMHKIAKQHNRSLNGEVLQALYDHLERHAPKKEKEKNGIFD